MSSKTKMIKINFRVTTINQSICASANDNKIVNHSFWAAAVGGCCCDGGGGVPCAGSKSWCRSQSG